ncbi:MAG TPA: CocE/NonD family hydrolase [Solirubrobacteraceae bacterium]|nr:CocE/NonD family hydrolase [Solirubrobacteraceae bacterium]
MSRSSGALIAALAAIAWSTGTGAAAAGSTGPLGLSSCGPKEGVYQCSGLVGTWDGVPLDTTLTLPSAAGQHLPLVVEIHGFGNSKYEYLDPSSTAYTDNAYTWARDGYAVLTYTARGLWGSCGTAESRVASPTGCARGWIHLADDRYEVRDTQELAGRLVDEGVVDPARIGVTGDSYGGGQSMALAALHDRVMLPDGSLVPWRSPHGMPLRIAAAAPVIPWTDLVYAIAPNGRTSADAVTAPGVDGSPVGVEKASFASGIFAAAQFSTGPGQPVGEPAVTGRPIGYIAPSGVDPQADVTGWLARASAGEPYSDSSAHAIVDLLERYHSAYYIDASHPPAPLMVASGFTDDLFPVDEALRFVNRTLRDHPGVPVAAVFGDLGHQRAANKPQDRALLRTEIHAWFDHYVRGDAPEPPSGVTALTETCPQSAPSEGPFQAPTFAELSGASLGYVPGGTQTILSSGGDPAVGRAIDPLAGGGNDCATTPAQPEPGTATYTLPPAPAGGYTLLGSPAVTADLELSGQAGVPQVAGRLWDVAPDGATQTLVARGFYRPLGSGVQAWQLHPGGWTFLAGHVAKLELLGADPPFGRPSNGAFQIVVSGLHLTLPLRRAPAGAPPRGVTVSASPSCRARRTVGVRVRGLRPGERVRRVHATARRHRLKAVALGGRPGRVRVYLDGLPRRRIRVRVLVVTNRGRRLRFRRVFGPCAPARPAHRVR